MIGNLITQLSSVTTELFLPRICIHCEQVSPSKLLCPTCADAISSIQFSSLSFSSPQLEIYSLFSYSGAIRSVIRAVKFHLNQQASALLGATVLSDIGFSLKGYDCLLFVPSHRDRNFMRGFRANEVLFSSILGYLSDFTIISSKEIYRRKRTPHFYSLNREQRFTVIKNAFSSTLSSLEGESILLLDDVCTTGATLLELASLCYNLGACKVTALVVAKED